MAFSKKLQPSLLSFSLLVAVFVFIVYLPALDTDFIWDDEYNILENPSFRGLSWTHLAWMFTTFYDGNYHPLCWLSLGLDYLVWGLNPLGYHLTNLILHCLNSVVLFYILWMLLQRARPGDLVPESPLLLKSCLFGTLFFAVHPLRVESVVWISTRGDLLCGLFILLTLVTYIQQATENSARKHLLSGLSLFCFCLSLLSRAWGITLPVALLVLDIYPLRRVQTARTSGSSIAFLLLEKIPYGLTALGAAVLAILAKSSMMVGLARHGLLERFMQSAYGLLFYPIKMFFPFRLSPLYLLDESFNVGHPYYVASVLLVIGFVILLWRFRKRWPGVVTASVLYAVTVSPLLGLVQSGPQLVADRYTYLSTLPFAPLLGAGILRLFYPGIKGLISRKKVLPIELAMWLVIFFLSLLTLNQIRVWRNPETFWTHVIRLNPANYLALNNLGTHYKDTLQAPQKALEFYNRAINIKPDSYSALYNRAQARERLGDVDGAIADYTEAIKLNLRYHQAYNNRGVLRQGRGDLSGALNDYNAALKIDPLSPEALLNRAGNRMLSGDFALAEKYCLQLLALAPSNWRDIDKARLLLKEIDRRRNAAVKGVENIRR